MKSSKRAFQPVIDLTVKEPNTECPHGTIEAVMRLGGSEHLVLQEYEIIGPLCEHVADEPNSDDLKALNQMVYRFKRVAGLLRIRFHLDKKAVADLIWCDHPTA